jgi:hypothetical protein
MRIAIETGRVMRRDSGTKKIMVRNSFIGCNTRRLHDKMRACRTQWMKRFSINISNPRRLRLRLRLRWTSRARFARAFHPDIACATTHIM